MIYSSSCANILSLTCTNYYLITFIWHSQLYFNCGTSIRFAYTHSLSPRVCNLWKITLSNHSGFTRAFTRRSSFDIKILLAALGVGNNLFQQAWHLSSIELAVLIIYYCYSLIKISSTIMYLNHELFPLFYAFAPLNCRKCN
jgi:hypothetical protein